MRKVVFWINTTLDGYVAGPKGEMDWLFAHAVSDEGWARQHEVLSTVDTVLLGRSNYEGFHGYWPTVRQNPASSQNDVDFSNWLDAVPKIIFSRTLAKVDWQNSRLATDDIPPEIARLKQQPGKDMLIMTSTGLAQSFMKLGLIDVFRINVYPVILGGGKPLFTELADRTNLKLVETRNFQFGVLGLTYERASG